MSISNVVILEINVTKQPWWSGVPFQEMTKAPLLSYTPASTAAFVPAPFPTLACSQHL